MSGILHASRWLFAMVLGLLISPAYGEPLYELVRKIENPKGPRDGGGGGDEFGISIVGVGENVLIGAYREDTGAENAGAAYLFDPDGNLLTTFYNPTPESDDWFGFEVRSVEDKIIIAAEGDNTGASRSGAVYLYEQDGTLLQTIYNPTPAADDAFGVRVLGVGDKVLVTSMRDDTNGRQAGAAYLFDQQGELLHTIFSPNSNAGDLFGRSVDAIGDDKFIISAYSEDVNGVQNSGAVYVFDLDANSLLRIPNPDPGEGDLFGIGVAAVGNDKILVGANNDVVDGVSAGSAYLYDLQGSLLQTIPNPTPEQQDWFGRTMIGVTDDTFIIGATFDDALGDNAGAAYLFNVEGELLQTFLPPEPVPGGHFSLDFGVVGDGLFIGSHFGGGRFSGAGEVYEYYLVPEPSTLAMLSVGVTLFLLMRYRNGQSK